MGHVKCDYNKQMTLTSVNIKRLSLWLVLFFILSFLITNMLERHWEMSLKRIAFQQEKYLCILYIVVKVPLI